MHQEKAKRFAIIGQPGSGKSTFGLKLGSLLNIPVHHLDKFVFEGDKKRDKQAFLSVKASLVSQESWIIEGCSLSTLEMRFAKADTIIYFHFPRLFCIWRTCKRVFSFDPKIVDTGCLKGINWKLIKYIWNFDQDKREDIELLRKRYPNVDFLIFKHPQDAAEYLDQWIKSI